MTKNQPFNNENFEEAKENISLMSQSDTEG
jgi:hypothetical protein